MELSIRFTTDISMQTYEQFLDPISEKYIIGLEHEDTNRHFQTYIKLNYEDNQKLNKLRYLFKKTFNPDKTNICIQIMKNENLKTYCTKEGNFKYKGFTDQEIKEISEKSYIKEKCTYQEYKRQLEQMYMSDVLTEDQIIDKLVDYFQETSKDYDEYMITKFMNRIVQAKYEFIKDQFKNKLKLKYNNLVHEYKEHANWLSTLPENI